MEKTGKLLTQNKKTLTTKCKHSKGNSNPQNFTAGVQCVRLIFFGLGHTDEWTLPVLLAYIIIIIILVYHVLTGWDGPQWKSKKKIWSLVVKEAMGNNFLGT